MQYTTFSDLQGKRLWMAVEHFLVRIHVPRTWCTDRSDSVGADMRIFLVRLLDAGQRCVPGDVCRIVMQQQVVLEILLNDIFLGMSHNASQITGDKLRNFLTSCENFTTKQLRLPS